MARRLVEQIRDGAFGSDGRLPSGRQLADTFGVSLASVREALRSLEAVGLVVIEHGRGVFLRPSRAESGVSDRWMQWLLQHGSSLLDLLEVRQAVETASAELAARRATTEVHAHLDRIVNDAARLTVRYPEGSETLLKAYVELDTEFHRTLAAATGNAVLRSLVETLGNALQGSREATVAIPGRIRRSTNEHRRIAKAVRAGNPLAARTAMYAHVQRVIEEVRSIKGAPARPISAGPATAAAGRGA
ncbi:MAG: FadR/GntR family transcriptional regulator [Armatimonadota bacterium]|nr:FadR/GntR family transcriptional regulator [Armatimonadota bacterium]